MLEFPLLCRLCGSKTENGLYIYCDEGKRRQVETKIRLYLHFQVLPSDSLPKKICTSCFEELESMHRFAINALKVQDNLSRLSKELPRTAIDVCKTFMTNYVHEAVMVNETVASLTNQEVTEMEVQVDPMVFLEDDQIDDCAQYNESENGSSVANQCAVQNIEENGMRGNIENNKNDDIPASKARECSGSLDKKDEITLEQTETKPAACYELNIILPKKGVEQAQQLPQESQQQTIFCGKGSSENDKNHTESADKADSVVQKPASSESPLLKKGKKDITGVKAIRKTEPKSASAENIKCTTYTCPICKKVLMKKGLFRAHLEVHKADHKYACEICLRVFKKEINLIRHRKSHSELTTFPCAQCNRVYPTKSTLRSHLVSHSDERPHVCNICSKSFKRNQDLKFHLNQHNGLRPYRCPYCTKAFASSGNCFSHRRRAHMQEIERDRALRKSANTAE